MTIDPSKTIARGISLLVLSIAVSACAISYDDSSGRRHILGFADVALPPNAHPEALAGEVLRVTSLGMFVSRHEEGTTIGLGYTSESTAGIRNNALVLGNPNEALATIDGGQE